MSPLSRTPLRYLASGGAILCFHSVTSPEHPAEGSAHVPLQAFKCFVRLARALGEIVTLSEIVRRHATGQSTSGLIAITLDDAYVALFTSVRDFISREAVPIAIFVVAEAADSGATYWWDRVDDLFPRTPPDRWRAFENALGLPDEYRRGQPIEYGPLRPLRQWLLATSLGRWPSHLEPVLQALEQEVGVRTRQRSMTFEELKVLTAMPWVEIGVHTVSHPVLPLLPDSAMECEIRGSYDVLRDRFARVLPVLAMPFGLYDQRTVRAAHAAGMMASLTLAGDTLVGYAGQHALPRLCLTTSDTRARLGLRLLGVPHRVRRWSGRRLALYPDLPSPTS